MFRALIENAADVTEMVNAKDYRNFTPLHYAAKSGNELNTKLILEQLSNDNEEILYNQVNAVGHRLKKRKSNSRVS